MTYGTPSPFPPSFEGNPWAYGFGLFGDVVAAALALALLLAYLFEGRRNREVTGLLGSLPAPPIPAWSVLYVYRTKNIAMLAFIVMRTLPDATWMLLWGEVSEPTIRALLALDLWMDGLAVIPFIVSAGCWAIGRQAIEQMMISRAAVAVRAGFPWGVVLRSGRIVLLVILIAIGVTVGKATSGTERTQMTIYGAP